MAYSASNPPALVSQRIGDGPAFWVYKSADDDATVNGTDYFASGSGLGMLVGDLVVVVDTATPKTSLHFVSGIDADGNVTTGFAAVA
jgi:hypothetical protein